MSGTATPSASAMVLHRLFNGQFDSYLRAASDRDPLWLFIHVPKTAGSSLNAELLPLLTPSQHIFVDYKQVEIRPFHEMLEEAVDSFLEKAAIRRYRYVTGHVTAELAGRITSRLPYAKPITLLRHPVSRFVSDYRYQCSPLHPGNEAFLARHPTLESYLDLPWECNKAAAHLVPPALRQLNSPGVCVDYLLANYAFIGIQESYALSLRVITTLAGMPRRPSAFKRVRGGADRDADGLTRAQERAVMARNALDVGIYEHLAARFRRISVALEAYLDETYPLAAA